MNLKKKLQPFPFPGMSFNTDLFKLYENVFCISDSAVILILKSAKASEDKVKADIVAYENELNKNQNKLKRTFKTLKKM